MSDADEFGIFAEQIEQLEAWTADEALDNDRAWRKRRSKQHHPSRPYYQWAAWNEWLPALEEAYSREPDPRVIFEAMTLCLNHGLPVPQWCARVHVNSWRNAKFHLVRTLDEAFGYDTKGMNLRSARRKSQFADLLTSKVIFMTEDEGWPVEKALREMAARINISYELAREWYYERRDKFHFLRNPENS